VLGGGDVWSPHPHVWLPTFKLTLFFPLKKPRFTLPLQFSLKLPLSRFPFPFQQFAALTVAVTDVIKKNINKILSVLLFC
jgi:hypothetical protein